MSVSRILNKSHGRMKELPTFITGIEHASIAGAALVASLLCMSDAKERIKPLKHLYSLICTLEMMLRVQANAKGIATVLQTVIDDNGWDLLLEEEEDEFCASSLYAQCRPKRTQIENREKPQSKRQKLTDSSSATAQSSHLSGHNADAENLTDWSNSLLSSRQAPPSRVPGRSLSGIDADVATSFAPVGTSTIGSADVREADSFFLSNQWNLRNARDSLCMESGVDDLSFTQPLAWDFLCDRSLDKHTTLTDHPMPPSQ